MVKVGLIVMSLLMGLAACQPQVLEIEVTRPTDDVTVPAITPELSPPPMIEEIEVTRLVPQEVTRVVSEETIIEVTKPPVGSSERPIQLLFVPFTDTAVLQQRAQPLVEALMTATDHQVEVGIVDDEQTLISLMCAAPADVIAFLSAPAYVLAHEECGAEPAAVGVNATGQPWEMGMIVVRSDSDIETLDDLADKIGVVPAADSLSSTLYFEALLAEAGVEPAEMQVVPGDNTAMLAVLNGEADFATGRFIPPVMPYEEREWVYGQDEPELWRDTGILPGRSDIGFIIVNGGPDFGGYRVRDARAGIYDADRSVFQDTEILVVSEPLPNETIAFGADFPVSLAREVTAVLDEFGADEVCRQSLCGADIFNWSAITTVNDADFDPLRFTIDVLDLSEEDLLTP